jgi:hypothetical protein
MSTLPTRESVAPALSGAVQIILALVQGLLPLMTAIIGGLWVAFTYLENQKTQEAQEKIVRERQQTEEARTRAIRQFEARRPFLDKQLDLYMQTAAATGKSLTIDRKNNEYARARERYLQLRYTELPVVAGFEVKLALWQFDQIFSDWEKSFNNKEGVDDVLKRANVINAGSQLSEIMGQSIGQSWQIDFSEHTPSAVAPNSVVSSTAAVGQPVAPAPPPH